MSKQYTSDNIKVLNDIEHIQLRSGMYIGEANDPRSLFSEMFDNAMDEVSAGHSTELVVEVDTKANRYTVHDFGRGIPHGKKKLENGDEKEVVEVLMTVADEEVLSPILQIRVRRQTITSIFGKFDRFDPLTPIVIGDFLEGKAHGNNCITGTCYFCGESMVFIQGAHVVIAV